ncbi:ferrous iron transporter B [Cellulomonas bogoriensis]|uniref:Iron transporter FeoB n=1 Tax=Cellulomonas bogoriensis 69B4 = DSM 16987 TaxID=1386082 RepID=A0A0A0BY49_9CELL|nr:ferrous iron transporter B [Cellulomonas bogoriensis]KGM12836.1 iron transporter FeoB [Cellulomonas bogoriensis 69B4 = DSM 16987]
MSAGCPGHAPQAGGLAPGDRRILLVGNPNVGKSTLFNTLTGGRQRVMNAPGTTVVLQQGTWTTAGADLAVTDLPGTYSLVARSPDETVVADALHAHPGATVVVLVDATAPSRSLYLLGQVARTGAPVVVVTTMVDVARARDAAPDRAGLEAYLGCPVTEIDPRSPDAAATLAHALTTPWHPTTHPVGTPDHARGATVPAALEDPVDDAAALFEWVHRALDSARAHRPLRLTRSDRADRYLLSAWIGVPALLSALWAVFWLTTGAAAPIMEATEAAVAAVGDRAGLVLGPLAGTWVEGLLVDGIGAGVGTVLAFAPLMALTYIALGVLEDSGYMARAAVLADRGLRALGLDGRAMLPLVIGFGCNLPALAATRTLPHARQRLVTALLVPWTSCAARLPVYLLLAVLVLPRHAATAVLGMYVLSVLLVVAGALVLRRGLLRGQPREALALPLPAYQVPRPGPLLVGALRRVRAFVTRAGGVVVAALTLLWLLASIPVAGVGTFADVPVEDSALGRTTQAVSPALAPAGLDDWRVTAAILTGFVAKEAVVGALGQTHPDAQGVPGDEDDEGLPARVGTTLEESSDGHPAAAAAALMVFVLAYTPCVATLAEQGRQLGVRWAAGGAVVQLAVAWGLATVVFQVGRLLT